MFGNQKMSHKTKYRNRAIWFILITFLSLPTIAYAHGNPLVVFGLGGLAFIHFLFAMLFVFRKIEWDKKAAILVVYTIVVFLTWEWGLDYKGPDVTIPFMVLLLIPLMTFLGLDWAVKKTSRIRDDK